MNGPGVDRVLIASLVASLTVGCMSARVFQYRGDDPAPRAPARVPAVIVLNDLSVPNVRTEIIAPTQVHSLRFGDVRFDALEQHLGRLFREGELASEVHIARDLSRSAIDRSGFVVQYTIQFYAASSRPDPAGVFAGVVGAILTGGLTGPAFVMAATSTETHRFQVEVRVYRTEDSVLASQPAGHGAQRVSQYDTSGADLVHRSVEMLSIQSGHCQVCVPQGPDADRFHREQGAQMARVIFETTAPAILAAMQRSLEQRPAAGGTRDLAPSAESSGLEGGLEERLRARLDERAAEILLCAGADRAALVLEWTADARVSVGVRGEDELVTRCVRAALGELPLPAGTPPGRLLHVVSR